MRRPSTLVAALLLGALIAAPAGAATIVIQNTDPAGVGFNDPTPAAPVGGNPGTTIGQQRLNCFNQAASIWGALLPSAVTIVIAAQFSPLTCNSNSAVLGSCGPHSVVRDFIGAEVAATWYHVALANKLSGTDQIPGTQDMDASFNATSAIPGASTARSSTTGSTTTRAPTSTCSRCCSTRWVTDSASARW